ncbi:transcriptional regulator [Salmonella enterica subsp. enterica]|nr:transcriptional regulator [Salmonella enterica subsp. enterica]
MKTAIAIVGTQKEPAKACGVSQAAVQEMVIRQGESFATKRFSVVKATGGKAAQDIKFAQIFHGFPCFNQSA